MASYTVDFDSKNKYRDTLNSLHQSVTDNSWARVVRHNSNQVHTVTASLSGGSVKLHLREKDLYLIGFENSSGTKFQFKDEDGGTGTVLPISSSYTSSQGLSILNEVKFRNWSWGATEISWAISTLNGFTSVCDDDFRKAFGVCTFSISEALRFHEVFEKVKLVVAKSASIRFSEFEILVKNWQKHSDGGQLKREKNDQGPADLTQHDVLKRLKTVQR